MSPVLAVGGVIVEGEGEAARVVLVQRGKPPMQGRWSLPGARVEAGETLVEALVRELREETGLSVAVGPLVEVVEIIEDDRHYVVLDYICAPIGGVLAASDDAAAAAFVSVARLDEHGVTEAVRRVVQKALELGPMR
jgi:8-oxo-dGTP diphosphatase